MGTLKLLASWDFVIVLVQPIGNLGVIPPLLTKVSNRVVEELLILVRTQVPYCGDRIGAIGQQLGSFLMYDYYPTLKSFLEPFGVLYRSIPPQNPFYLVYSSLLPPQ